METIFILVLLYLILIFKMFYDTFHRFDKPDINEDYYLESIDMMNNLVYTEHSMINKDNLKLNARYYQVKDAERIVLAVHGYKGFGIKDMGVLADVYLNNNCNYFVIDHRAHMSSEGKYITMGSKEKYDIREWIDYINSINSNNLPIYLTGVSMGAASSIQSLILDMPDNVKGLIADCGFTNANDVLLSMMKASYNFEYKFIIETANMFCKLVGGFDLNDSDCRYALSKTEIPIVFIHGSGDTFVPSYMSKDNYNICNSEKELHLFEGAEHCMSYLSDKERYTEIVLNFFEKTKEAKIN